MQTLVFTWGKLEVWLGLCIAFHSIMIKLQNADNIIVNFNY